jgi:uncharacterized integral membrane protein (TIGR00697 family)
LNDKTLRLGTRVAGIYVALQFLADIMSLRIISLAGMSIDGGTLIYPLTFTVRDLLHRVVGKSITRSIVLLAAIVNIFMVFCFWIVSILPPDMAVGLQVSFGAVLLPAWRIVTASILAETISGLLDGEMYEKWETKFGKEKVWGRVLFSNAFSIPLDSFIFSFVAFAGLLPMEVVVSIFISNVIIKYIIGSLSLPIIYATKN